MRRFALPCAVALMGGTVVAHADLVTFSTSEAVSIRDCIAGTTACDNTVSPAVELVYGGSPGAATSSATATVAGYGTAKGSVSLSGTIGAPILKGSATSESDKRTNTTAFALQSYTYAGTEVSTRTFGGTLTYSQTLTADYGSVGNGILAGIDLFTLTDPTVDVGTTPAANFGALSDPSAFPGYNEIGFDWFNDPASTPNGAATLEATATLNPGDIIWVWVYLQTPAPNGSVIDAANTFVTSWDDPTDLTPAVAVPEPATFALLGLGLAGLGFARRHGPNDRSRDVTPSARASGLSFLRSGTLYPRGGG